MIVLCASALTIVLISTDREIVPKNTTYPFEEDIAPHSKGLKGQNGRCLVSDVIRMSRHFFITLTLKADKDPHPETLEKSFEYLLRKLKKNSF